MGGSDAGPGRDCGVSRPHAALRCLSARTARILARVEEFSSRRTRVRSARTLARVSSSTARRASRSVPRVNTCTASAPRAATSGPSEHAKRSQTRRELFSRLTASELAPGERKIGATGRVWCTPHTRPDRAFAIPCGRAPRLRPPPHLAGRFFARRPAYPRSPRSPTTHSAPSTQASISSRCAARRVMRRTRSVGVASVRRECAAWALDQPEIAGVWGATSQRARGKARALGLDVDQLLEAAGTTKATAVGPSTWQTAPSRGCAGLLSRKDIETGDGYCRACRPARVPIGA